MTYFALVARNYAETGVSVEFHEVDDDADNSNGPNNTSNLPLKLLRDHSFDATVVYGDLVLHTSAHLRDTAIANSDNRPRVVTTAQKFFDYIRLATRHGAIHDMINNAPDTGTDIVVITATNDALISDESEYYDELFHILESAQGVILK
ncbi:hypothetical protein H2C43_07805 [Corynebacterium glutamicum]|uniref:Uncharacterized protein n=1 Tax=Corynebacterium glutamicum (strain ATCC 13032 / DSM 20300 / JCM 1318 / BCRC 11384 / CCUG 27702 / LMG 3730 / NBRC 12168 / NCIMB 10025 / NRRL B-2784 / 534) TaxID=196627 RepID=Q8NPI2_CORGL|nr:hypothetical protein [Corynebacterium glutamicum]ARV64066.1 hypothetical protein B7P23_03730 [Corynebacterium glutamicum]AUI01310.1 hypothetical protein CYL77_09250 [Corynebacterium glutamicum]AUI04960.1 hypothetical protein C0I99_12945 [Corynebacterium glutamicum]MBA4570547.1 hypothetical protein [Corynebacterium glutamicum]MBA4573405.1 hypothetical protein [Corynebacterium glutamicum]